MSEEITKPDEQEKTEKYHLLLFYQNQKPNHETFFDVEKLVERLRALIDDPNRDAVIGSRIFRGTQCYITKGDLKFFKEPGKDGVPLFELPDAGEIDREGVLDPEVVTVDQDFLDETAQLMSDFDSDEEDDFSEGEQELLLD